ncbi:MAG: insulinase family protein [Deltaproteobacteria bacterium]|nr:insulinase family protein [Deltaproteobacteria bacterium]MBW2309857.1 insulinase family protein [Deltaproteobacteria bacterium]
MKHRKTVFDNGIRLITERVAHAKSISMGIWVNAGSRDEDEEDRGIFHFIEHMIFKGTKRRSAMQIAKDLDAIGGLSNAFTTKEQTCFYARVLDRHLPFIMDLLSDIFINSVFAERDMELEKSVVLQEIHMMEDSPDEYVQVLFDQAFWGADPLGMPILGTKETVAGITRDDIVRYVSRFYSPTRVVIAAAGNLDHDLVAASLKQLFEALPRQQSPSPARSTPSSKPSVSFHSKELEQVHLCLGAKAASLSARERFAETIFNTLLGGNMSSRLFQEIREKRGLAYAVYSSLSGYIDAGMMKVYVATDKEQTNQALELIVQLIKGIQRGDLDDGDLARAKECLTGGILLGTENNDVLMTRLARNEFIFGKYISYRELLAELNKVTLDEVVEASKRIFSSEGLSLTVLGPIHEDQIAVDPINF